MVIKLEDIIEEFKDKNPRKIKPEDCIHFELRGIGITIERGKRYEWVTCLSDLGKFCDGTYMMKDDTRFPSKLDYEVFGEGVDRYGKPVVHYRRTK